MHVPGWHEATSALQKQGKLQVVGIIQEQHPDRARLFMQWKRMDWPVMVDSLNLLGVSAVPITLAIDEAGIVRFANLPLAAAKTLEGQFVSRTYGDAQPAGARPGPPDLALLRQAVRNGGASARRAYTDGLILWGSPKDLGEAVAEYKRALKLEPNDGPTHFRLGVAYRKRYDSALRQPFDFQKAVEHWSRALDINPNQYIWRRRIQQYGPRLSKPYSFYDWVRAARSEIEARGETPSALEIEPGGAEFATPSKLFERDEGVRKQPDPAGRVARDKGEFIAVASASVPAAIRAGGSARLHAAFQPNSRRKAHWNNEVDDMVFWVDPPNGWSVDTRLIRVARPRAEVSQEERTVDLEVKAPDAAPPGRTRIPGYVLYYVCEDAKGVCMYRRQDIAWLRTHVAGGKWPDRLWPPR